MKKLYCNVLENLMNLIHPENQDVHYNSLILMCSAYF